MKLLPPYKSKLKIFTKLLIICILINISFCGFDPKENKEKMRDSEKSSIAFFSYFGILSYGSKEMGDVIDHKNGTLTYTYRLIQTNAWFGNKTLLEKIILIRRCLIGQIYRLAQNDCRGTGSQETVWGAAELQWCPTNDRSCEINGKADPEKSPAAKACADDTFLGKKWSLPTKDSSLTSFYNYHRTTEYIYRDWIRYYGSSFYFWSEEAESDKYVFSPFVTGQILANKNSKLITLCKGEL